MKRLILDTDIGTDVDDAMALSLLAASPEAIIEGVTTVHADTPLRARIARKVLSLAGRDDIPVIAGAGFPLQSPLPENFHWNQKLRGHEGRGILSEEELVPAPSDALRTDDAARFIIERAKAHPGELSLLAIGSLTNVAMALQREPRLPEWIRELTLMGGLIEPALFPWPPYFETNLNCDPLAARLVFDSGIPLTIVPMDVTTQVFLTPAQRERIRAWNRPLSNALVVMMEQMLQGFDTLSREQGLSSDFYEGRTFMHDPLAVYTSLMTRLVGVRRMHIELTVVDQCVRTIPVIDRPPNMQVCTSVAAGEFVELWIDRIKHLVGGEDTADHGGRT
jgi:purine nucleosidase